MATYVPPKKGVEYITYIALTSQADTKKFQVNPTIAAGDFKISIDGGALANLTTLPSVAPASSVWVKITLSTDEMNGDNIQVQCIDAAGAEWADYALNIPTSARQIDDLAEGVWDYLVSALGATTTVGGYVKSIIDAIKAKTDIIGASSVTVTSPVTDANTIELVQGDDYLAADARQLDFTYSGQPSFTGGTCKLRFTQGRSNTAVLEVTGTVTSATNVRFEPTAAQTATLTAGSLQFEVEVTLSNGHIITPTALIGGRANVRAQAA
jgi:hypothetical protein